MLLDLGKGRPYRPTERWLSYALNDLEYQESDDAEKQECGYNRKALELSVLEIQFAKDGFFPWEIGLLHDRIPTFPE